jgi:hypothetical protein
MMDPKRDDRSYGPARDILEWRFTEEQRLGPFRRYYRDILLIGRDKHSYSSCVGRSDEQRTRLRKELREGVRGGFGECQPSFVISLPNDNKMIAPVDRPHTIRIEIRVFNKPGAFG